MYLRCSPARRRRCSSGPATSAATATLPFSPTAISQGLTCSDAWTVHSPGPGGALAVGTITAIAQAGTYRLPDSGQVRVSLTGSGDYLVMTMVDTAPGAPTSFSARGIAGSNVRQWTLTPPGELQLHPDTGAIFTIVVCAP